MIVSINSQHTEPTEDAYNTTHHNIAAAAFDIAAAAKAPSSAQQQSGQSFEREYSVDGCLRQTYTHNAQQRPRRQRRRRNFPYVFVRLYVGFIEANSREKQTTHTSGANNKHSVTRVFFCSSCVCCVSVVHPHLCCAVVLRVGNSAILVVHKGSPRNDGILNDKRNESCAREFTLGLRRVLVFPHTHARIRLFREFRANINARTPATECVRLEYAKWFAELVRDCEFAVFDV